MAEREVSRRWFLGRIAALAGLTGAAAVGLGRVLSPGTPGTATGTTAVALDPPRVPTVSTTAGPAATTTTSTTAAATTTTVAAPVVEIAALCRDGWGALPVAGSFVTHEIERLTVHHTAALLESNSQAPARIRQHQRYHLDRGWPDLAYHFIVDAAGYVYEGRPVDAVGDTGTEYDPTGHFLVCCEGNFDEQEPAPAQLTSLANVLAWAAATFAVSADTIRGHRDWAATSCPGDLLYPFVESGELAALVAGLVDAGGVTLTVECGDSARAMVAAIEQGKA